MALDAVNSHPEPERGAHEGAPLPRGSPAGTQIEQLIHDNPQAVLTSVQA
jgi:hypothetical protein